MTVHNHHPFRVTLRDAVTHLASVGYRPNTIVDVGAAGGTTELYDEFPNAELILIEPLIEHEAALQNICAVRHGHIVLAAAGPDVGMTTLHVHPDLDSSSILQEADGEHLDGSPRTVPMTTLRQILTEIQCELPILAKLDVQGFEHQVLSASGSLLEHECSVVVIEASLFKFYRGSLQMCEIIAWMQQHSFIIYDLVGQLYRPLDRALAQVDLVFVKEHSPLRSSHSFATPTQRLGTAFKPLESLDDK